MNNAEKYVYKVYQTKNFSDAAKEMYISQPAMSATIKNLEKKLGYQIFNRKTLPVTLTREGEVYIEYLEQIMETEQYLNHRIASLHTAPSKTLSIGGSNSAAFLIIPKICKEFCRSFPNTNIKIDVGELGEVSNLFDKLNQGVLELVISSKSDFTKFNSVNLWEEKYIVVIRKDYPGIEKLSKYSLSYDEVLTGTYLTDKEITDWTLFENINIFRPGKASDAWKKLSDFFNKTTSEQYRILNFRSTDIHYNLMLEGLGGLLIPKSTAISKTRGEENLCYFAIQHPNNTRQIMISYKKDTPLSESAKNFIAIAREICSSSEIFYK